ncbi:methionyl-tRNA formyltransferase [Flavobacteriaceae bacterium MAR_2010_188]|nr:methionyl-tRNA formyltransferase [Flavobacteriaceae bacterium MAR_2010_188]
MKRKLRIVFMGTPEFAVATLKRLVDEGYDIAGVITAPDRPAGRGQKLQKSDVKVFAETNGLKLLQPTNLKDEGFLNELKNLKANLQIVVAFRMLPRAVWEMPEFGTFNLHASLLPDYRGAAPINWAIINGESKTGATTFFIDDKIDTGEIILQDEIAIKDHETVGQLHDKLMDLGSKLVLKTVNMIEEGEVTTTPQSNSEIEKSANKLNKENTKIDWTSSMEDIYNKIRGLNPYPAAWSYFENNGKKETVKLFEVDKEEKHHTDPIGKISIKDNSIYVSVKNGYVILKEIQLPGKRKMTTKSLLNGYDIEIDAKML